jgi:S-DNA-T family DNA segregation ATPase FtsK/SpoIIIE
VLGTLVLIGCAAGGVSLLTWSAADPSLMHATGGATRNALGPIGAILADLVMQLLGIAGAFVLLPPSFWALQLVTTRRLRAMRCQLLFAPAGVVLLAAAAAALPSASAWQLPHGYGGMLGDLGLGVMASVLSRLNADRSTAAAGLFYFAAGMSVLLASLGLTRRDLKLICRPGGGTRVDPRALWRALISALGHWQQVRRAAAAPRREPALPFSPAPAPRPAPADLEPRSEVPTSERYARAVGGREAAFDSITDRASRAIAERFAPQGRRRARSAPPPVDAPPSMPPHPDQPRGATIGSSDARPLGAPACRRPPLSLLKRPPAATRAGEQTAGALSLRARRLEDCLRELGAEGSVGEVRQGPLLTVFGFEPHSGVTAARLAPLAEDIARAMGVASARVAHLPGSAAIGIELANTRRGRVHLRELLEGESFRASDSALPLALGRDVRGTAVYADLARLPHLLIAGMTGSGKSVAINAMMLSLLYRLSPDQCRLLLIDPKLLELSAYNDIPHLLSPVVTDPRGGAAALQWAVAEMDSRYRRMARLGVRNIEAFNTRVRQAEKRGERPCGLAEAECAAMPYIVVVVEELADLLAVAGATVEAAIARLARMARTAGMHAIIATQRPSADVITATVKANFAARISFKVASRLDSRAILDEHGGEQLLGQGDMLFSNGSGKIVRLNGPYVCDEEIEAVASFLRQQGEPRYVAQLAELAGAAWPDAATGRVRAMAAPWSERA